MKFNDEELNQFKEDLKEEVKLLEKKYQIKISLGNILSDETFFSLRITAEHNNVLDIKEKKVVKTKTVTSKKVSKPSIQEETIETVKDKPKKKVVETTKNKVEDNVKNDELNFDSLTDDELTKLDLNDLGLDDIVVPKKESKITKDDKIIDDVLSDNDLKNIDLDDLGLDELEGVNSKNVLDIEEVKELSNIEEEYDDIEYFDEDEDENEPDNIFEEKSKIKFSKTTSYEDIDELLSGTGKYSYSFEAKLIQTESIVQDFYTDIKNELLSYKGVSSKITWENDIFSYGRDILAKIDVTDNCLNLYLALDCDEYIDSRFDFVDVSNESNYAYTPFKVVIKKFRDEEQAFEIINEMMESFAIESDDPKYDDYHMDFETKEELIDRGLIKKL